MPRSILLATTAAIFLSPTVAFQASRSTKSHFSLNAEQTVTDLDLDDMQSMFEKADKTVKIVSGVSSFDSLPGYCYFLVIN